MIIRTLLSFVLAFTISACASTTTITSSDPDSKIYIDDDYRGKGTVSHSDTKIVGSITQVRIEKAGCKPKQYAFSRTEEFDVGACIGGIFLLVPFLWIKKYQPEHAYEFACEKKN